MTIVNCMRSIVTSLSKADENGKRSTWEKTRMRTQGRRHSRGIGVATWVNLIVKQAPSVHPHFRQSHIVAVYDATHAPWKCIGGGLAKDMPDVGTRDNEELPPASIPDHERGRRRG